MRHQKTEVGETRRQAVSHRHSLQKILEMPPSPAVSASHPPNLNKLHTDLSKLFVVYVFFLFRFIYVYKNVFMGATCMPGALGGQKSALDPRNWSYSQL